MEPESVTREAIAVSIDRSNVCAVRGHVCTNIIYIREITHKGVVANYKFHCKITVNTFLTQLFDRLYFISDELVI